MSVIIVTLDMMLARRKMTLTELSHEVGITVANLSVLKSGRARGVRFSTMRKICKVLRCKPGDILDYMEDDEYREVFGKDPVPNVDDDD
jgi:putative transcriptional regulator